MNDKVKIALIAAVAAICVTWLAMHYSPYQTCVRATAEAEMLQSQRVAEIMESLETMSEADALRRAQIDCAG